MTIKVFDKEDTLVCTLDNDNALLGSYHVDDGMRLHVSSYNNLCFICINQNVLLVTYKVE